MDIWAEGEYPTKSRTPVQHVAKYQNDGTEHIKPAMFVEKAKRKHRSWQRVVFLAMAAFAMKGEIDAINQMGLRISYDINNEVNRIRTGRLKKSFRPKIKTT